MQVEVLKDTEHKRVHPMRQFVTNRIVVADDLIRRYKGPDIVADLDAQILLCVVLGTLSKLLWPKAPDGKRFIELLVRYSRVQPSIRTISIPTLIDRFPSNQALKSFDPHDSSQVITPHQIDRVEAVIKTSCPELDLKDIRSASYAKFIYKYLRCGLIHEYSIKGPLNSDGWLDNDNLYYSHYSSFSDPIGKRLLFIPYEYLRNIVTTVTSNVCSEWEQSNSWELNRKQPGSWWIDP